MTKKEQEENTSIYVCNQQAPFIIIFFISIECVWSFSAGLLLFFLPCSILQAVSTPTTDSDPKATFFPLFFSRTYFYKNSVQFLASNFKNSKNTDKNPPDKFCIGVLFVDHYYGKNPKKTTTRLNFERFVCSLKNK